MAISSRTTEGLPNRCAICGKQVWVVPSIPPGDATCPHCGSTIWFPEATADVPDVLHQLTKRGAVVQTDDEGQVLSIQLIGRTYTDAVIDQVARLSGITGTLITPAGAARLRRLMPETQVVSKGDERDDTRSPNEPCTP